MAGVVLFSCTCESLMMAVGSYSKASESGTWLEDATSSIIYLFVFFHPIYYLRPSILSPSWS